MNGRSLPCKDIDALAPLDPARIEYLRETIKILRGELSVPLIGFSGAPFTLASYLIEGKPTRQWIKTKRFMMEQPAAWARLMEKLSEAIVVYLSTQIDAGAQAVQLFDSWVGCLSPSDYRTYRFAARAIDLFRARRQKMFRASISAPTRAPCSRDFADVDCEVIGLDWRVDIAQAKNVIGGKAIQGNLDPVVLLGDEKIIKENVDRIFASLPSRNGFIFNLGHGVLPETDDRDLKKLVEYVHEK